MYKIRETTNPSIFAKIAFITIPLFNLYAIPYSLAAKILDIICLYFIDNQYIIFALLVTLARQII